MAIQLSEHFTYRKLLRFTLPSVIMMIFTSIYGVVDGLFVSNLVGKIPFAAVNLIFPVCMLFGSLGFMVGTGGSALVAKTRGDGIWFSIVAAELAALIVTLFFFRKMRPRYQY